MSKQKTKKYRGSRTCGKGTHKNRRGGGSRGGRGNAGICKHHFVRALQLGMTFGKHGFKRPVEVIRKPLTVNVGELDESVDRLISDGFAEKKGNEFHINLGSLGYSKVLGNGQVTKPLVVTASEFSVSAKAKIEGAGGKAVAAE